MGISVGFGVGPVRVSKRIGGGRGRASSGPGLFSLLSEMHKEIEKAQVAEGKAQAAARYESAARRVANGSREPQVVVEYLEGKAHNSRSIERQQFVRNQAVKIRSGYEFDVNISPSGTVTVKVLDSKRAPATDSSDEMDADYLPSDEHSLACKIVKGDHSERTVARYLAHRSGNAAFMARERILAGAPYTVTAKSVSKLRITVHDLPVAAPVAPVVPAPSAPPVPDLRPAVVAAAVTFIAATVAVFTGSSGLAFSNFPEALGVLIGSLFVAGIIAAVVGSGVLLASLTYSEMRKAAARREQRRAEALDQRIEALERDLGFKAV